MTDDGGQHGREEECDRAERPRQRRAGQPGPARNDETERRRARQAPPQVVEDLPAIDAREPVADARGSERRHGREQPSEELPVAAHPSVHALGVRGVRCGEALEQHDVAGERHAPVDALEQIVADDRVLGRAAFDAAHEAIDVVDPFAAVDAGAEQVLVRLGDRVGVDVEADITREDPREPRRARARRRGLDPGLQDRVSGGHPSRRGIERGSVQRVRERPDQALGGAHRELGVAIERDHESNPDEPLRVADMTRVAGLEVPAEQAVQLVELAALALPSHEPLLLRIPPRLAVQQVKGPRALRAMSGIEALDLSCRMIEQRRVRRERLRVHVIGQQRELQLGIGIR